MGTQNQDQGKQQTQGSENRPRSQQGSNQPGARQPGQEKAGQQSDRQQGGGSQGNPRRQEQQGDRQRDRAGEHVGASTDDIDQVDDAGFLGQTRSTEGKGNTR